MATGDSQGPGSDLPAPYRSPWRSLAEAISAAAADLRLRLRELIRLNREGQLPLPGFWPESTAALFWPLLLALVLALVLTAGLLLRGRPGQPPPRPANPSLPATASTDPRDLPLRPQSPAVPVPSERQAPGRDPDPVAGSEPASGPVQAAAEIDTPLLELDPLLALLSEEQPDGLLLAASPDPTSGTLRLTLSSSVAAALGATQLRQRAESWQQRALANGYERLELVDAQGRVLGRQALVGSGMILLAPDDPA